MITKHSRLVGIVAGAASLALLGALAGCTSSTAPSGETTTPAAGNDCAAKAKAAVDAARAESTPWYPTSSDMSKNAGKKVTMITNGSLAIVKATADAFVAAAKAAGMNANSVFTTGKVDEETAAVQQALAGGAQGLVMMGDPAQLSNAVAQAKTAGVPITWFSQDASVPLPDGVKGSVPADWHADGALIANWILADSNCAATVGIVQAPTVTSSAKESKGIQETLAAAAPAIKVATADISFATITTDIPTGIQTMTTKNPNLGYIATSYDSLVTMVAPALQTAGVTGVKLLGHDGNDANFDLIRKGGQALDIALPPVDYIGAYIADNIGTAMAGGTPRTQPLPSRVIDATNVGTSNSGLFPAYADALAKFKKAWGVK